MNGLHLIADLYGCQCASALLCERDPLETLCISACADAGLTPLGSHFHQFFRPDGERAGVTGTVVLAESHLAIHTWPERGDVTLDVYVCNYSRDNSERAIETYQAVIEALQPQESVPHRVLRGRLPQGH